ncbi:DUF4383 domain-containing protein [Melissospora conviva]|uniref:DUF4383 domain-containing protein n=1 Tax=Melissospora conviva TaxID=3388432 RepID=UPI003B7867C8
MAKKSRDRRQNRVIQRGSLIRRVATVVAIGFLGVGILGFVPGITTNYETLSWAGDHSQAQLFGVFHVSVLHNLLHLAYGVVGLLLALNTAGARVFLTVGGAGYLMLWLMGLVIRQDVLANWLPVDEADNWLHLGLGLGMLVLGLQLSTRLNADNRALDDPAPA